MERPALPALEVGDPVFVRTRGNLVYADVVTVGRVYYTVQEAGSSRDWRFRISDGLYADRYTGSAPTLSTQEQRNYDVRLSSAWNVIESAGFESASGRFKGPDGLVLAVATAIEQYALTHTD